MIQYVVTDETGAVIPGVAVVAANVQTGDTRKYVVSPLRLGDYKLERAEK